MPIRTAENHAVRMVSTKSLAGVQETLKADPCLAGSLCNQQSQGFRCHSEQREGFFFQK